MNLEVLISTTDARIERLLENLPRPAENINYLIIHQIISENLQEVDVKDYLKNRSDVRYYRFQEKGLSRSRNRALERAKGDICLVADDDLVFKKDAFKNIINTFNNNPEADIITFKIETPVGQDYKNYTTNKYEHNILSIMRSSSVEIVFRRKPILANNLRWDEDFGLGGNRYSGGLEHIFLYEALKKNLELYFIPISIVIHPKISSGNFYTKELIHTKGALFARIFGLLGFVVDIIFSLKKYKVYKDKFSFFRFIKLINKGSLDYLMGG